MMEVGVGLRYEWTERVGCPAVVAMSGDREIAWLRYDEEDGAFIMRDLLVHQPLNRGLGIGTELIRKFVYRNGTSAKYWTCCTSVHSARVVMKAMKWMGIGYCTIRDHGGNVVTMESLPHLLPESFETAMDDDPRGVKIYWNYYGALP